jgi:hypothetical protein
MGTVDGPGGPPRRGEKAALRRRGRVASTDPPGHSRARRRSGDAHLAPATQTPPNPPGHALIHPGTGSLHRRRPPAGDQRSPIRTAPAYGARFPTVDQLHGAGPRATVPTRKFKAGRALSGRSGPKVLVSAGHGARSGPKMGCGGRLLDVGDPWSFEAALTSGTGSCAGGPFLVASSTRIQRSPRARLCAAELMWRAQRVPRRGDRPPPPE